MMCGRTWFRGGSASAHDLDTINTLLALFSAQFVKVAAERTDVFLIRGASKARLSQTQPYHFMGCAIIILISRGAV